MKPFLKKNREYIFILFVILLALLPRSIEIFSGNYLFGFDQGLFYEDVREIVEEGKPTLIGAEVGGIGGFFQGPGWNYFLTIPYILFNGDPYGGMIFMFLLGMITVILPFFLFRNSLGSNVSLLISFFIAISPGIISQSRFIWPPFVIPSLTVLLIFFVIKSFKNPTLYIPLSIGTIGFMTHFEIATGVTLLISTFVTLLILSFKSMLKLKVIIYSILAFITTQSSLILFDLRHDYISSKGIINLIFHNRNISTPYNFQNHLDIFKDSFLAVSHSLPFFVITIIFCIMGGVLLLRDSKVKKDLKKLLLFVSINTCVLFLVFLPMKMVLWSWWVLEVPIFLCVIFGVTFSYLLQNKNGKIIIVVFLITYGFLYINTTVKWYKNDFYDYGGTAKIKGKIDAIDYIYNDANGKEFGLFVFTPPVYTYPYDYILHWHAKKKYNFIAPKEKLNTFYLLMETDSLKPTSHIGWQETVIKDGEIEKEITLPSGFIIQKRVLVEKQ